MNRSRWAWILVAACGLSGCPKRSPPEPLDAGVAAQPQGPVIPDELRVSLSAESPEHGTILVAFDEVERPEIPQVQALQVRTNLPLANYRIRLMDEVDRAMVSDDTAKEGPDGVQYEIALSEPLKTGHRYTLVVDSQTGPEIVDGHGRTHPDIRLEFQVAGEREKPPPPVKPKPKRRQKRR
jgi:hypothetical protein